MSAPVVSLDDFRTYLNNPTMDPNRATLILSLAQTLCESIVTPLPAGAEVVILDVAARAYLTPTVSESQGLGPFEPRQAETVMGGLWLTVNNERTLRRLTGQGGAFTVDMTPATAGQNLPWWDTASSWAGWDDWDTPS